MNNQENLSNTEPDNSVMQASPVVIRKRPKIGTEEGSVENDFIGINLLHEPAVVLIGKGDQWNLSEVGLLTAIQSLSIIEGDPLSESFDETQLNCLSFSSPKRIEIYTSDTPGALPYITFQEVEDSGITGWQIYAPTRFMIAPSPVDGRETETWQYSVSIEAVSMKQVKFYQNCNYAIDTPPPSGASPVFEKTTSSEIAEVNIS